MNTRQIPTTDDEGVSAPYRQPGPMARQMPRSPAPTTLPPRFYEHAVLVTAGVHASWLWFCACDKVHEQGGHRFLTMTVVRQLMDFEGLGVKAKRVVQDGIDAGLFAQTKSGILIQLDALDERRGG